MSSELDEMLAEAAANGEEIGDDYLEIDLSEAATFEPFEAKVPVEIIGVESKRGKEAPHTPFLELKLRVFEGEYEGRTLFESVMLAGKGAGFGRDKLAAFDYMVDPEKPRVSPKALKGRRAFAECAPDTREEYKHKVVVGKLTKYVSADEEAATEVK